MFQLKWIWHNLQGYRKRYVMTFVLSLILGTMYVLNPQILSGIIDQVFVGTTNAAGETVRNLDILIPSMVMVGVITLLRTTINYIIIVTSDNCALGMITTVRERIYANLQSQDMSYYEQKPHWRPDDPFNRRHGYGAAYYGQYFSSVAAICSNVLVYYYLFLFSKRFVHPLFSGGYPAFVLCDPRFF